MAAENDGAVSLPTIHVGWDEKGQRALIQFEPTDFRNWNFVEAILRMAADAAKRSGEQAQIMQAMEAQRTAEIARRIKI